MFYKFECSTFYTANYHQLLNNPPTAQTTLAVMSLAGTLAANSNNSHNFWIYLCSKKMARGTVFRKKTYRIILLLVNFLSFNVCIGQVQIQSGEPQQDHLNNSVDYFTHNLRFSIRPLGGMFSSYMSRKIQKKICVITNIYGFISNIKWQFTMVFIRAMGFSLHLQRVYWILFFIYH